MKKVKFISIILACVFFMVGGAFASSSKHHGSEHPSMDHPSHGHGMGHDGHQGHRFRTATVDGYQFSYELIDMREKMKEMKADGHGHVMNMTHHMMVYVKNPEGHKVDSAKVGFLVVGPNKEKQKLMCMGMAGGFGADVDFTATGTYSIKTKVVVGDKKLIDAFSHKVE